MLSSLVLKMPSVYILCGGLGTRLKSLGFGLPKPLVNFPRDNSKSILEQILIRLCLAGCKSVNLIVSASNHSFFQHRKGDIEASTGVSIDFIIDPPNISGTAAWLLGLQPHLNQDVVVLNGDTYLDGDLHSLINANLPSVIGAFTSSRNDAGNLVADSEGKVLEFSEKSDLNTQYHSSSLKYSGILKISSSILPSLIQYLSCLGSHSISIEYDVLPFLVKQSQLYISNSSVEAFDIGTPERMNYFSSFH